MVHWQSSKNDPKMAPRWECDVFRTFILFISDLLLFLCLEHGGGVWENDGRGLD